MYAVIIFEYQSNTVVSSIFDEYQFSWISLLSWSTKLSVHQSAISTCILYPWKLIHLNINETTVIYNCMLFAKLKRNFWVYCIEKVNSSTCRHHNDIHVCIEISHPPLLVSSVNHFFPLFWCLRSNLKVKCMIVPF